MNQVQSGEEHVYRTKIDSSGRVVLPVETKLRQISKEGDVLVVIDEEDSVRLTTLRQAVKEAQALYKQAAQPERILSEELLRERRDEAARD
jgi:bifunctional DNA-binding transcriptional regulator/antitoxin component of YhaV-PrlF toxin-antitoxin module